MAKKSAGLPSLSERSCNRIWIELERDPKGYACTPEMLLTFREQQVELANNLLQRLQQKLEWRSGGTQARACTH
jgi:hypothetical protein